MFDLRGIQDLPSSARWRIDREQGRPLARRDGGQLAKLFQARADAEGERSRLVARMERDYPRYAALKYPKPCTLAEARACLGPNETALLFVPGAEASYLLTVDGGAGGGSAKVAVYALPSAAKLTRIVEAITRPQALRASRGFAAIEPDRERMRNGEGVDSLSRAFLYAGSRAVLCSLWSVADRETAELMTDVYRHLRAGQSSQDALREAQLAMIRQGKPPYFWAPFVLIGE